LVEAAQAAEWASGKEEDPEELKQSQARVLPLGSPPAVARRRVGVAASVAVVERDGFNDAGSGSIERLSMPKLHRSSSSSNNKPADIPIPISSSSGKYDDDVDDIATPATFGPSLPHGVNLAQVTRFVMSPKLVKHIGGVVARKRLNSNGRRVVLRLKPGDEPTMPMEMNNPEEKAAERRSKRRKPRTPEEDVRVDVDEAVPVGMRVARWLLRGAWWWCVCVIK
jgi:hypothetical protein